MLTLRVFVHFVQSCWLHKASSKDHTYLMLPSVRAAQWLLQRMALALETALNTASSYHQQQAQEAGPGQAHQQAPQQAGEGRAGRQRVCSLALVRGTPFYGYHASEWWDTSSSTV
jgi:hypothetical protein